MGAIAVDLDSWDDREAQSLHDGDAAAEEADAAIAKRGGVTHGEGFTSVPIVVTDAKDKPDTKAAEQLLAQLVK